MKMKIRFVSILFLLFSKILFAQHTLPRLSNQVVKEDFEYLYQSLQATHYNLFAFQTKEQYDDLFNQLRSGLTPDSLTLIETTSFYQKLVSFANTGHCEIDYPAQSYINYAYAGGTVFPLELAFENGKVFKSRNYTGNTQISTGDEIVAIDQRPIHEIQQQLFAFVSAEREYFKNAKIEFWSFPRLFFQLNGRRDHWDIQIRHTNGKLIQVKVAAIPVIEYEGKRKGEVVNPKKAVKFYGDAAYLNAGPFGSNEKDGEKKFQKFIDSAFTAIKKKGSKKLIIDLRNNPGGHNAYSDYLISYIADKPFKWYAEFSVKTSKILKEVTAQGTDSTDDYTRAVLHNADGEIFPYDFPAHDPIEKSKRYTGKVYILVNRQTYSMAAVSAALIQDYRFGTIAGEETGDVPTLYASQFSYTLPRTGITVKVPKGYIVRVNGSKELKGVQPDIYIQDHLLDDKDEILEGLLLRLKGKKVSMKLRSTE